MSCCVISTYFLYLISRTDVHFVGHGDGRPHLGVKFPKKTSVCEQKEEYDVIGVCYSLAAGQGPGL